MERECEYAILSEKNVEINGRGERTEKSGGHNMNRDEFLRQLREALQDSLSGSAVQENVDYYNSYISEEISKGKSEDQVLQMLGDPWVLARTLIDAADGTDRQTVYESESNVFASVREGKDSRQKSSSVHEYRLDTWWKKLLLILTIIMVLVLVFAVFMGVVRLLMPIVVPVLIVMIIIRAIGDRKS